MKLLRKIFIPASDRLQTVWIDFKTKWLELASQYVKQPTCGLPFHYFNDLEGASQEHNNVLYRWYKPGKLPSNRQIHVFACVREGKAGWWLEEFKI